MKKILTWYFIFTKRQLKRISTIFILVSMLLLTIGLKVMSTEITASIDVGFYMDNEDSIMTDIKNSLESHEGLLKFINYSSKEQLELAVSSGTLQCGYIFDDDFSEKIVQNNTKNLVTLIETPDNIISLLGNLVIMATVMENTACHMLIDDILSQDFFVNVSAEELVELRAAYNKFATNGSTFSFDYDTMYEDYKGSSDKINIAPFLTTPIRGIIAIFVFISALTGGVTWFNDQDSFIYANIPLKKRHGIRLLTIAIPTILAGAMGYISIITLLDNGNSAIKELYTMAIYSILCLLFSFVLSYATTKNVYCALIPVFILGSIVCCPIIFNLGNLIPSLKFLQHLFLPTYYLMF